MTRELKLALIVGFALVLVVTVLVSDHLSKSRRTELAATASDRPASVPVQPPQFVTQPEPPAHAVADISTPAARTLSEAANLGAGNDLGSFVGNDAGPQANPVASREESDPVVIRMGDGGDFGQPRVASATEEHSDLRREIERRGGTLGNGEIRLPPPVIDVRRVQDGGTPRQDGAPQQAPQPNRAAPAQAEEWYTVQPGDTAMKLARRFYGDGDKWKRLAEVNGSRIGKDGTLRSGVRIKLPTEDAVLGRLSGKGANPQPANTPKPEVRQADNNARPPAAPSQARPQGQPAATIATYTVKKGDTLGEIAQRELGSSKRAGEIVSLNKINPDKLFVGQVLKLPPAKK